MEFSVSTISTLPYYSIVASELLPSLLISIIVFYEFMYNKCSFIEFLAFLQRGLDFIVLFILFLITEQNSHQTKKKIKIYRYLRKLFFNEFWIIFHEIRKEIIIEISQQSVVSLEVELLSRTLKYNINKILL